MLISDKQADDNPLIKQGLRELSTLNLIKQINQ